ncbi:MAG: hypothetical protein GDA50_07360 [Alphaproteobacteria bacterium GM202ARS2]|nr:hypothetical protein [Alphaproteobacteria bacterium GM202ARS2]
MVDNVDRFPVSTWQRIINRRGKRAVNCIVSDRYLVFGQADGPIQMGTPVAVDVMTELEEKKPRKLCSLILTVEDLKKMVEMLESKQ